MREFLDQIECKFEKIREVTAKYEREMKEAEERALQARKAQSQAADDYDRRLAVRPDRASFGQ